MRIKIIAGSSALALWLGALGCQPASNVNINGNVNANTAVVITNTAVTNTEGAAHRSYTAGSGQFRN
ncbi:MAG: hypothetical protein WKF84_12315 [Pyrinomonadaceae bacterium]